MAEPARPEPVSLEVRLADYQEIKDALHYARALRDALAELVRLKELSGERDHWTGAERIDYESAKGDAWQAARNALAAFCYLSAPPYPPTAEAGRPLTYGELEAERDRLARELFEAQERLCGVVSASGPSGEPLACGYAPGHDGPHSWATLPTFLEPSEAEVEAAAKVFAHDAELDAWIPEVRAALIAARAAREDK